MIVSHSDNTLSSLNSTHFWLATVSLLMCIYRPSIFASLLIILPDSTQQSTKHNSKFTHPSPSPNPNPQKPIIMPGTRQSARNASQGNSSPTAATPTNGTKRKADATSPTSNKKKQQKTLEEVIPDKAKREEVKAVLANEAGDEKTESTSEDKAEKQDTNGGAGGLIDDGSGIDRLLTLCSAEATKTEENGTNGHDESAQEAEKPNAFDKIQADENDEGKTAAKVKMHDLDLYNYELLMRRQIGDR